MSGPYTSEKRPGHLFPWIISGPAIDREAFSFVISAAELVARLNAAHAAALEQAAKVAEKFYGGPAHTYASENADRYRAQDEACRDIASAIRALISPTTEP